MTIQGNPARLYSHGQHAAVIKEMDIVRRYKLSVPVGRTPFIVPVQQLNASIDLLSLHAFCLHTSQPT